MTNSLVLRDCIKQLLSSANNNTAVYFQEAPEKATYPYVVFDYSRVASDNGIDRYSLEVNVWDSYKTSSRVMTLLDNIESLNRTKSINNSFVLTLHKDGSRGAVLDEDKAIKRQREIFLLNVVERRN